MSENQRVELRSLEGRHVTVCLRGGTRIDDTQLVSAGRHGVDSLWLFSNGVDEFVSLDEIVDVVDTGSPCRHRVA